MTEKWYAGRKLIEMLYIPANKYLQLQLGKIVYKNNLAHGDGQQYGEILYQGRVHNYYMLGGTTSYGRTYELKDELVPEMNKYLTDYDEVTEERKVITRFIQVLFIKVPNKVDLKDVLGENLYAPVAEFLDHLPSDRLPDEKLAAFLKVHKQYVDKMQNRVVDNLLARDLYNIEE